MISIKKLSDKNKLIIFLVSLAIFFTILTIWYFNKPQNDKKLVISEKATEIITTTEINIGLYNENSITNINPISDNNEIVRYISNLIYNRFFEYSNNSTPESKIIATYAQIDEKNYVFKLKDDIYFHNGEKLISQDIKDTIEKIYDTPDSYYSQCVDNIQNIKIIDNTTLRINLIKKDEEFPKKLIFPIISDETNIGTNDYKIKEINNEKIILENEKIGQVLNIYIYNNLDNLYGDFKNKKLNYIKSVENLDYKKNIGEFGYSEKGYEGNKYICLEFNTEGYFRNSKLKEAVLAAINTEEIIAKIYNGNAYDVKEIKYDLDEVVETLEEERYTYKTDGWYNEEKILNLKILLNKNLLTNLEIAYIIKEQLEQIGIKIELVIVEEEEYNKKVENKEYDILISNLDVVNYSTETVENAIICNKLNVLYSSNLSGEVKPNKADIFYDVRSWKVIVE